MQPDAPVSDLERRKYVRLRRRGDLGITLQKYEGRTFYVIKDPVSLRYYRFKEQENFLLSMMDGVHTLDDAQKEFEKRFRPERLTLEDLEHFGQQLLTAGLVQNESPQAGQQLWERRTKRRRTEILQTFTNILYIKIPVFDPEKLLTRMLPWVRWMFSIWFFILSVGVMLGAVLLVLTHFETFVSRLPSYQQFFNFKTVIYLWAALGVVKVIHEFGHGLSCKAFGGEVHEMGFLFLCFSPAMYCNVSDSWTLPDKWKRIIISGAGIYVELMIAAIATFIWWNTPAQPFLNNLCLSLMIVCSVSTVLFNGNPLMRYDGYYVLADWLEIPNLRDKANRYLQRVVMEHCLGIEVQPEPYMELWRRILFVSYAIVSWVYRWVITFVILRFMANFLGDKLKIISTMLAFAALGSMLGWPAYRLIKNIRKRGRLPDMKSTRVSVSAAIVFVALLAFFLLPLPVTRIRQTGLVQVNPKALAQVHIQSPGTLEVLLVKEGDRVKKGKELAKFSNQDLDNRIEQAQTQKEIKSQMLSLYQARLAQARNVKDRETAEKEKIRAQGELLNAETALAQLLDEKSGLVLTAPLDGIVIGLPSEEDLGKRWDKDQGTPFCTIGDPGRLRVLVPLPPADFQLLQENLARRAPPATIRVHGRGGNTWTGTVDRDSLPKSEAKEIPMALSSKAGGPLAAKPPTSANPNQVVPQSQVYLVGVNFDRPDDAIAPGSMSQVKIHNEYRSCAWWVWRTLSSTFDLGLAF